MASFTKVNLGTVHDSALDFGYAPDMEARFAAEALGLEGCGLTLQRLAPGFRQPFGHRHHKHEEIYLLLGGTARANLDGEIVALSAGDALRVAPPVWRCIEAGPEGAELLALGPRSTEPPPGDAEMEVGWWR